ncbi:MAG: serine/threonine protein kinase [Gammaproteobacteria bacterium]|jgi:serine/threonine protein kinase|nr:serine/threonine protein kinase [Gammaproteobacteria bacterium]
MSIKVIIIDGHADFRSLLMHHVTTHWPDAIVSAYDPLSAGHLPDEFSGAGNDIVLLGDVQGDRDPLLTLRQFAKTPAFPPIVYFGNDNKLQALAAGASAYFRRDNIRHNAFIVRVSDILRSHQRVSSTDSLFVGDMATGIHPLIKGYRFIKRLAVSEHSALYLAQKDTEDHQVVLKVLRQVPDFSDGLGAFDRFLQEYEMIAELDHPNIVDIYDLGVSDDHAHIAMEYVPGGDLKERIKKGVSEAEAIDYTRQIAGALTQLHSLGILHRDLKPGNIMVRDNGSLALIDFGLAKRMRLEQEITGNGEIFGTPYYMSPEQGHADDVDERSDVYSLGIIFYEMLTGKKPFVGADAMSIIFKHTKSPVPVLPYHLSRHQALINLLLAKRPEDRLQSAQEVLEWL